ncbi:MAG: polysaccharide pyruvyl transferase family protein [Planctomycetota bacterium]
MDRMDMQRVDRPAEAEVIFLNGGATMTECWRSGFRRLYDYGSRYPDTPVVVLPSSFDIRQTDFPALLRRRRARTLLIARDRRSLRCLEAMVLPPVCELALSDDAAFELAGSRLIREWKAESKEKHVLVVIRGDREGLASEAGSGYDKAPFRPLPWWRRPRHFVRHVVLPRLVSRRDRQEGPAVDLNAALAVDGTADLIRLVPRHSAELSGLGCPVVSLDVSDPRAYSFETFCRLIAEAKAVVTTRLHVGVFSALLEKQTVMVGQSYGKLEGIYERSMQTMGHVSLIDHEASRREKEE